ncbi:MAG: hypothetical protein HY540_03160 [Deltaproteobacteria bacterium]|nr:hypothetical protein [Deltaproteobacteria bacterium]
MISGGICDSGVLGNGPLAGVNQRTYYVDLNKDGLSDEVIYTGNFSRGMCGTAKELVDQQWEIHFKRPDGSEFVVISKDDHFTLYQPGLKIGSFTLGKIAGLSRWGELNDQWRITSATVSLEPDFREFTFGRLGFTWALHGSWLAERSTVTNKK